MLRTTFKMAQGAPGVSLKLADLINYDQFLEFMKKIQAIYSGSVKSTTVHLSNLYDEATHKNQAELDIPITSDTILIFEGNLFVNEISAPWFDVTFFVDTDLTTGLDLERILKRAREKGKTGVDMERYYRDDVRFYRRPLVRLHRETNARFFDFFLDNTCFAHPILVQNPMKTTPKLSLKSIIPFYRAGPFSEPAPREPTFEPEIGSSV